MDPVRYEVPEDAILEAAADRVERRVLDRIGHARRRRWRRAGNVVGVVAAGLGLFAGGLVVGAAALPKDSDPDWGTTIGANGKRVSADFAIGCFYTERATVPTIAFSDHKGKKEARDRANPGLVCSRQAQVANTTAALGTEAERLRKTGRVCGYIDAEPGGRWSWGATMDGITLTNGQPMELPASCDLTNSLTITPLYAVPTAACAIADNRVGLYPLKHGTAAQLCGRLGLPVWNK